MLLYENTYTHTLSYAAHEEINYNIKNYHKIIVFSSMTWHLFCASDHRNGDIVRW